MEDTPSSSSAFNPDGELSSDFEVIMLKRLVNRLLARLADPTYDMPVSEMELIRKLCSDNSISFASIRRGDFGTVAQEVAEEFPFDDEGRVVEFKGRG